VSEETEVQELPEEQIPPGPATAGRRFGRFRVVIVPALAILTALAVGGLVIIFSDPEVLSGWASFFRDPLNALRLSGEAVGKAYAALFEGSIGDPIEMVQALASGDGSEIAREFRPISETVVATTPLILAGLSVAVGFKAGLFNIGAEGQITVGALAAGLVGFGIQGLPLAVHLPLTILAGFAGGALWGFIPGILKARTGAHEVIVTIMLNFVAFRLLDYALRQPALRPTGRFDPISKPVAESAQLPKLLGGTLRIHAGIILALLVAWGVWWLLFRTTKGFEFRAVGANPDASRYAGIRVGGTYVIVMAVAGGLAGLAGANQLTGVVRTLTPGFSSGLGFDAIALALLGGAHPGGVVAAAFMFGILRAGSTRMQAATAIPVDIIVVIQALVIMFIAAPALVRAIYRIRARKPVGTEVFTKGWAG
jgi:simple sugar transport system permease protein